MNVLDIILKYLKENRYDGLYYDGECGCKLDDLCPCGELSLNCQPGYEVRHPDPEWDEFDWYICESKDGEPWKNE